MKSLRFNEYDIRCGVIRIRIPRLIYIHNAIINRIELDIDYEYIQLFLIHEVYL